MKKVIKIRQWRSTCDVNRQDVRVVFITLQKKSPLRLLHDSSSFSVEKRKATRLFWKYQPHWIWRNWNKMQKKCKLIFSWGFLDFFNKTKNFEILYFHHHHCQNSTDFVILSQKLDFFFWIKTFHSDVAQQRNSLVFLKITLQLNGK